jgi:hypothetical protein
MGKPCKSLGCIYPIFSSGYCKSHQILRKDEKYLNGRKSISQKHIEKMKSQKKVEVVVDADELDKWFDMVAREVKKKPYCENCGEFIAEKYYRHASAHILTKKNFKSVATHELNYLILGAGCGCHNLSHRWDKFSQMPIWNKAVERIQLIYPSIAKEERRLLPEIILQELNPELIKQ